MQHSAVFLGGAVLGGIISAACGFDLYPIEEAAYSKVNVLKAHTAELEASLAQSREEHRKLAEAEANARTDVDRVRADLALARQDISIVQGENQTYAARLDELSSQIEDLTGELTITQEDLSRLQGETLLAREAARTVQDDLFTLGLRLFSIPRPETDRDLAAAFLLSGRPTEQLQELVLQLRYHSPNLLLSLGFARAGSCSLESLEDAPVPNIVPSSAELDEAPN